MRNETRDLFNQYLSQVARLNDVPDARTLFTVSPAVEQKLVERMQENSDFMKWINVTYVDEQMGEKLFLGVGDPIASTTETRSEDRTTRDPAEFDANGYYCTQTNFDTHIPYEKLDAWANLPGFQIMLRDAVLKRQTLDRIMIGFNGISRAATSNATTNPLLQDVNNGWLQKYREHAPARVFNEATHAGQIRVGSSASADYNNIDALVMDAVGNMIDPWKLNGLCVIAGNDLLSKRYFDIANSTNAPTEQLALNVLLDAAKRIGGLPAARVPFVPAGTIFITPFDNLSLYIQRGKRRRRITENAARDRVENYESSNEAYVVEDYGRGCLIENIVTEWP